MIGLYAIWVQRVVTLNNEYIGCSNKIMDVPGSGNSDFMVLLQDYEIGYREYTTVVDLVVVTVVHSSRTMSSD